ncbi:MAG: cyclic nucleotide-binding domain-containing protein [Lachnospiraceae bacterium]|nr:cyclic nucleotide-binding domain-containing protein [Lachnospiraceae bacterium]
MEKKIFKAGEVIQEAGQPLEKFTFILEGTATALYEGGELQLKKGDVIGVSSIYSDGHLMSVTASSDLTAGLYSYNSGDFMMILHDHPETKAYFVVSVFRQLQELFNQYKKIKADCMYLYRFFSMNFARYTEMCEKHHISPRTLPHQNEICPLIIEDDVEPWLNGYYRGLQELVTKAAEPSKISVDFNCGMILSVSRSIFNLVMIINQMNEYKHQLLNVIMNGEHIDLFEFFTTAYLRVYVLAEDDKPDDVIVKEILSIVKTYGLEENPANKKRIDDYLDKYQHAGEHKQTDEDTNSAPATVAVQGSLNLILDYAGCDDDVCESFRKELKLYKGTANKGSTEDADRKRRMVLSKHFYSIYSAAAIKSLTDNDVPRVIKMFLNFGYVDEELAGMDNASYLYNIVDHLPTSPEKGVYTFYQWITAIYKGEKAPCRNEFDLDYYDYLNEQVRMNNLTKAKASEMVNDTLQMVIFEIDNAFPSANKVTNGRITTFCPVFSEHNLMKTIKQMLVSADIVRREIGSICAKDFGAFCREAVFSQPESGITKETINVDVWPDVILLPNVGIRGVMWQEIEGKKRTTPARFMLSLFQADDLSKILYRLVAEFRWEMCKRVQGARWNDASERSLTSDYSDYIASYRKNNDLSSDVKEKIKSDLVKCKNKTKEMFISDYTSWLQYESGGSPRLNKVVRLIMFTYCPFSKEIRDKIKINPFYTESVEKYDIRLKNRLKHYDNLAKSLSNKGFTLPEEISETRRLLEL